MASNEPGVVVGLATQTVDVNGAYLLGATVLLVLSYLSYCSFVKWLSRRGAMDIIAAGRLRLAAARGDVVELELIRRDVKTFDVNASEGGFTALHAAAASQQPGALLWLCQHGANVAAIKDDGWKDTALHYAASNGCLESVRVLLAYGADACATNFADHTPAHLARKQGHSAVSEFLFRLSPATTPSKAAYEGKHLVCTKGVWTLGAVGPTIPARPAFLARAWEGVGSAGTELKPTVKVFRILIGTAQVFGCCYIVWRALRTLRPGLGYIYSMSFWMAETAAFLLGNVFVMSLWNQIERPTRSLTTMFAPLQFPAVDVYIACYSEPVEVIEATAIAALNLDYPGDKLTVRILDDGKSSEVKAMVHRLQKQLSYMQREAKIRHVTRDKAAGVPHHAKAGNINNCLLKGSSSSDAEYILVLDCDMIVHPSFLLSTLGHFYTQKGEEWVPKTLVALLQTPQDFWNVDAADPMVHCARFFYGPMLQGRDGIGACPCCGTGVVFRKDVLVSIGGQAYGSITEDYNTAMQVLAVGFATMFLNERLVFGMSPDDIAGVFQQRLRWAMGAIQIMMRDNPLQRAGLTFPQALLFFEAAAHHFLAISTIFMAVVPIVYLFTEYSPIVVAHLWEFCVVFGAFYLTNRIAMWYVHRGCEGGDQELWRGSQMWVWMAPNHIKAILQVLMTEVPLLRLLKFEISFVVTSKEAQGHNVRDALSVTWPFLLYYAAYFAGAMFFVVNASLGRYSAWQIVIFISALAWGALIILCVWPPVATLLPRLETESGWKVEWQGYFDSGLFRTDEQGRLVKTSLAPVPEPGVPSSASVSAAGTEHSFSPPVETTIDAPMSPFYDEDEDEEEDEKEALDEVPEIIIQPIPEIDEQPEDDAPQAHRLNHSMPFSLNSDLLDEHMTRRSRLISNIGRVNLPRHTASVLVSSAFITSVVLPEPSFQSSRTSGTSVGRRMLSLEPNGRLLASTNEMRTESVMLPSFPEGEYQESTFRHQQPSLQALSELTGNSAPAGANTSMHYQNAMLSQQPDLFRPSTALTNSRGIPRMRDSLRPSPGRRDRHLSLRASDRVDVLMRQLGSMGSTFGVDNASLVLPVLPDTVYEHTIAARPNFDQRRKPQRNFMFLIVNGLMIGGLIAGAVFDAIIPRT